MIPVTDNRICIHLHLKGYLRQWLVAEFGAEPVLFPRGSVERDILELFLRKRKEDELPDFPEQNTISIVIPNFKDKPPAQFNVLPPKARATLCRAIYMRFRISLWSDLHTLDNFYTNTSELIYAWMESHGIECSEQNWETIRQQYYRIRKFYSQKKNANKKIKLDI